MEDCAPSIEQVLDRAATDPAAAGRALMDLLARHGRGLSGEALAVLKKGACTPGQAHLVNLLIENDVLPGTLADPSQFSLEEAVQFVGILSRIDPLVDIKLARWILNHVRTEPLEPACQAARRILSILEQTSAAHRLGPLLVQLLRVPDPRIRSKVALLLGRSTQDVRWALADPDARVRANAVEVLWGVGSRDVRKTLWETARDTNNRVVGNALLALHRLGEPAAVGALAAMSRHSSPRFRATAAWVMGQTRDPAFLERLRNLEADPEDDVRRNARLALARMAPAMALESAFSEQLQPA